MDILYVMVFISLGLSFGFLAFFFWAVDSDQMNSLDSAALTILDDENTNKGKQHESK